MQSTSATAFSSIRDAAALVTATLRHWLVVVMTKLPHIVVALIVVAISWLIARMVRDAMRQALQRTPIAPQLAALITTMTGVMVLTAGVFVSLGVLGLDKTVSSLLAGVGIVGLALGFAFQDVAANFMAGVILSVRQSFAIGHVIQSNDRVGTVRAISLQSTTIQQFTGEMVWLPNRSVVGTPLVNFSATGERRVDIDVRVAYEDDLEMVRRVAIAAVDDLPQRLRHRPLDLFYTSFNESSVNFTIRFWVRFVAHPDYLDARSEAMMAIRRAFDREGIAIPYPRSRMELSRTTASPPDELSL